MAMNEQEIARRKEFLQFGEDDIRQLGEAAALAEGYAESVIEAFYAHLLSFDETGRFFEDPGVLERVKRTQKGYFLELTQGAYGPSYVEGRLGVGAVHARIDLPLKWYLGMYAFYLRAVASRLLEAHADEPARASGTFLSFLKLAFFDIGLTLDTIVAQREDTIRKQQEAIRELSTPVLPLRPGLLILPLVGVIDSQRARQITEGLLEAIGTHRAMVAVIDITGVPAVDSMVANHLIQTAQAARLMGAIVIVSGISTPIAQTLVRIGIDPGSLNAVADLQSGLEQAEHLLAGGTEARSSP